MASFATGSSNGNVGVSLVIWVVGGLTAILSALCYNELALSIPESGGEYCYVTYAFGPAVGFLIPWMKTFLPTANAIVAMTFAQYALQPFFLDESPPSSAVKLLTACGVLLVTAVNILSVKTAVRMQVAFTVAKFLAIGFVVVGGVVYSAQDSSVAENTFRNLFDSESLKSITFLTVSRSFFQVSGLTLDHCGFRPQQILHFIGNKQTIKQKIKQLKSTLQSVKLLAASTDEFIAVKPSQNLSQEITPPRLQCLYENNVFMFLEDFLGPKYEHLGMEVMFFIL